MTRSTEVPSPVPPYNPFDDEYLSQVLTVVRGLSDQTRIVRDLSQRTSSQDRVEELIRILRDYFKATAEAVDTTRRSAHAPNAPHLSIKERRELATGIAEMLTAKEFGSLDVAERRVEDACVAATINGAAEIAVGAMVGGPVGALGGLVLGTVGVMLAC